MLGANLYELIQELRANENGYAQDRILLCEINNQLKHIKLPLDERFRKTLVNFTWPHQDAALKMYEHGQDFVISLSKRNLINAWDAYHCLCGFNNGMVAGDVSLKEKQIYELSKLLDDGLFNCMLSPEELLECKNLVEVCKMIRSEKSDEDVRKIEFAYSGIVKIIDLLFPGIVVANIPDPLPDVMQNGNTRLA